MKTMEMNRSEDSKEMEKGYAENFPKEARGDYSKRTQKTMFEKFPKAVKELHLFEKRTPGQVPQGDVKDLYPVTEDRKQTEWQWTKGVVDSGAVESVAHPSMCPQYPAKPSVLSAAGEGYTSASGDFMPNSGEQVLPVTTADGRDTQVA